MSTSNNSDDTNSPEWEDVEEDLDSDDSDDGRYEDAETGPYEDMEDDLEDDQDEEDMEDDEDDNSDDQDDEDDYDLLQGDQLGAFFLQFLASSGYGYRLMREPSRDRSKLLPEQKPDPIGRKLMQSGDFGPARTFSQKEADGVKIRKRNLEKWQFRREMTASQNPRQAALSEMASDAFLPSSKPEFVMRYPSRVYCGQFSGDGNIFYSCTQDMAVRLYDTSDVHNWKFQKRVTYPNGRWTLTDATLTPNGQYLGVTSITPEVLLANTDPDSDEEHLLDLSNNNAANPLGMDGNAGIWSIRFSGDGSEIVAGTNDQNIYIYDIERGQTIVKLDGHRNDVNAVCFADASSPHIIFSGSDDATVKVWDRRSLAQKREAGVFTGHTEGVTYIDSKGDGRYVLSNGKDQCMKLWDMRKMMDPGKFARSRQDYSDHRFDYRSDYLPRIRKHPDDLSLVTFKGHTVLRTLIRCHFSPPISSGSQYVYSGCSDGRVFVYNMDGTYAKIIDVVGESIKRAKALAKAYDIGYSEPQLENDIKAMRKEAAVRDASWSPVLPVLAASGFEFSPLEGRGGGAVSLHAYGEDDDSEGMEIDENEVSPSEINGVRILDNMARKVAARAPQRLGRFY